MPKYLWQASYTREGVQGLLKEGGTSRRQMVEDMTEALGGKVEGFYYAFGEDDVFVIADLPDHETAAAISLTIAAAGAVRLHTTVLMEPEEIDKATQKSVSYRPPGQ
jgi:uncharacterized protein with GYD domain